MSEGIQVPSGLIRTWKAAVLWGCAFLFGVTLGGYVQFVRGRVEVKTEIKEVPYPACKDEIFFSRGADAPHLMCSHPEQRGTFERRANAMSSTDDLMLSCACPHSSPEAGH
jgi:hypothetical protein